MMVERMLYIMDILTTSLCIQSFLYLQLIVELIYLNYTIVIVVNKPKRVILDILSELYMFVIPSAIR